MNAVAKITPRAELAENVAVDPLSLLRAPFPPNQVSKLPKESKKQREEREADRSKGVSNCPVCGGWHHKNAVHLDYVGHAALTDRLLDVDPHWNWEPLGFTPEGLPALDRNGGLWIRLTVCGQSRLGYGSADGKGGGDAVKELIGDALRNAAMRFGAALDLWHKGDLHAHEDAEAEPAATAVDMACNLLRGAADAEWFREAWEKNKDGWKGVMAPADYARVVAVMKEEAKRFAPAKPDPAPVDLLNGDDIPEFN